MPTGGPTRDLTRMTLLGLLASKPMHGYELRQQMKDVAMEHWVDIQQGALYPALQRMTADGFLEVSEITKDGKRPSKTVYRITSEGRAEHLRLLRSAWADPALKGFPVDVALYFIWFLPAEEVAMLLTERIYQFDLRLANLAAARLHNLSAATEFDLPAPLMEILSDLLDHAEVTVTTERKWATRVLERLTEGAYDFDESDPEVTA
jgi:DNA-binding PadR family transcriptional regulator